MKERSLVIGVDAGCLGVKDKRLKVGVYTVALNALIELARLDKKNTYYLYSFEKIDRSTLRKFGKNFYNIVIKPKKGWATIWLPLRLKKDNIDVFLGLNQFLPYLSSKVHKIGIVHDLAFFRYPKFYQGSIEKLQNRTKSLAHKSDQIITVSEAVKNDVRKKYRTNVPITVLRPGVKSYGTKEHKKNQFLFVGALKRGKNIPNILKAFDLFQRNDKKNFKFVIVGGDKWLDPGIDSALSQVSVEAKSKILFKGFVSDKELSHLYSTSYAFISPSFYEGFGLTHAEAMSYCLPVVASDKGSQSEVIGDAGIFANPNSPKSICEAMHILATDKKKYSQLSRAAGEISKQYKWSEFGKGLYEIIARYEKEKDRNSKRKIPKQV